MRCEACDHNCRVITGTGPEPCRFLFIGEKPGREEDARRRVFVGDTGRELDNTYLGLAGIDRPEIRITNVVKCRLGGNNNKPSTDQIRACGLHWLPDEIERASPEVIVLMGATATSLVPRLNLDIDHGYPLRIGKGDSEFFGGWEGWVVSIYHPASGLHDTGQMIPLLEDFERLGKWLRGRWEPPRPLQPVDYKVIESIPELTRELADESYRFLPIDTERDGPNLPWSLQFSTKPGKSRLIFSHRTDLLEHFALLVTWGREGYMLHNAGQDLDMLEAMGLPALPVRDTQQEAYHLGNQPQGLKALGWRLCGVRMQGWKDLVTPYSREVMVRWLTEKWDEASDNRVRVEKQLKTKVKVEYKPSELERHLKRILSHAHKPEYDIWEKVGEIGLSDYPVRSIAHVPLDKAVEYACRDADVTGQVGIKLEELGAQLIAKEWNVLREDWDK